MKLEAITAALSRATALVSQGHRGDSLWMKLHEHCRNDLGLGDGSYPIASLICAGVELVRVVIRREPCCDINCPRCQS